MTDRCKRELLHWRDLLGPEFSMFVFPSLSAPDKPRCDVRYAWKKALGGAGLEYFWLYNLRHSYASRLSATGTSDIFVAQMIGHASPGILQKYAKAVNEYRRDAVKRMEDMRNRKADEESEDQFKTLGPGGLSSFSLGLGPSKAYYSLTTVPFPQHSRFVPGSSQPRERKGKTTGAGRGSRTPKVLSTGGF